MKRIISFIIILLILYSSASADTWNTPAYIGHYDSAVCHFWTNESETDTSIRRDLYSYDTSFTVSYGNYYRVWFEIWFVGEDSALSWAWEKDMRIQSASGYAYIDIDNSTGSLAASQFETGAITTGVFAAETDIVSSGAITTSGGAVSTVGNVSNMDQATIILSAAKAAMDSLLAAIPADTIDGALMSKLFRVFDSLHDVHVDIDDKTGYSLSAAGVDAIWDEDTTGHYTSPHLAFTASQTGAGSLTKGDITEACWAFDPDSVTYTNGLLDSLYYIRLKTVFDSLIAANVGISPRLDSLQDSINAGATITEMLDSLFQKRQPSDTATGTYFAELLDFVDRIKDSIYVYKARWDSALAALADASIGDKVWTDAGTRTITDKTGFALAADGLDSDTSFTQVQTAVNNIVTYTDGDGSDGIDADIGGDLIDDDPWNNTTRTLSDYSGVWSVTTRQLTHFDEDVTTIDIDATTIGTATNLTTNNDKTGYALSAAARADVADDVWDEDSTGHYTSPNMAFVASQTSATSLTEAGIADAVWDEDTTGHFNNGTYGYEGTGQGAAGATAAEIWTYGSGRTLSDYSGVWSVSTRALTDKSGFSLSAAGIDDIWNELQSGHVTSGSFGIYLNTSISSRSDFDETADQVIVTTNNDKTGYRLSATGVDDVWDEDSTGHYTSPNMAFVASQTAASTFNPNTDSVLVANRGEIAAQFADSTWDEDTTGHYTAGAYGYEAVQGGGGSGGADSLAVYGAMVQAINDSSLFSGAGAYTYYVQVVDSASADAPIPNVVVFANNMAESLTNPWEAVTDASGYAIFRLEDSVKFIFNGYGYAATADSANIMAVDTLILQTYSSSAGKSTVIGWLQDAGGGAYDSAEIVITLEQDGGDSAIYIGDTLISRTFFKDTANINGYFSFDLYAIPDLTTGADSLYYSMRANDKYGRIIPRYYGYKFHVPSSDTNLSWTALTRWR